MKTTTRDLAIVLAAALLTLAPAGLFLAPRTLGAQERIVQFQNGGGGGLNGALYTPVAPVSLGGVSLSVKGDCEEYEVGAKPVLTLSAARFAGETRTVKATVSIWDAAPPPPMSRIGGTAQQLWSKEVELTLGPKGKGELRIETGLALSGTVWVQIGNGMQGGNVAKLAVKPAAKKG